MKAILCNGFSVRAIQDDHKTQTRRVCIDQTAKSYQYVENIEVFPTPITPPINYTGWAKDCGFSFLLPTKPRYQVGDVLWVRETWCVGAICEADATEGPGELYIGQCASDTDFIPKEYATRHGISIEEVVWRPSIFMPKKHARIFLEVTGVRVERVQDISEEDCFSEGIKNPLRNGGMNVDCSEVTAFVKGEFQSLWDSINAKRGYGWDKNPWVWVYDFKRIEARP